MRDIDIDTLEKLFRLLDEHRIDRFQLGDLKVTKTVWSAVPEPSRQPSVLTDGEAPSDEDLLFWSSDD